MVCSTWSWWGPSMQPAGTEQAVRNMIAAADLAVIGEFVELADVYGPGRAAKGPGGDEVLLMGGFWEAGQRIVLFGVAADPTDGYPKDLYYSGAELFEGLCVRSGDPLREKRESCQGRYKVPWDQREAIIVAQSGEGDEVGR